MRPLRWTSNGLVLAAPLFARQLFEPAPLARSLAAVVVFCAVSSGVYLVNDARDAAGNPVHPRMRRRPIAAGELSDRAAMLAAAVLLVGGAAAAAAIRPLLGAVILGYVALMLLYSYGLKRVAVVDVFAIAAGFVLRAAGGAVAIGVAISPWLYVCTMLGALVLGFGERRRELATLGGAASQHRANLDAYSLPLLDQMIAVAAAATATAYALYTFDAHRAPADRAMMLTIPFVLYGLCRYLYLLYGSDLGGGPETLVATDRPLLACVVGWVAASATILYLT